MPIWYVPAGVGPAAAPPVPVRLTVCGLLAALLLIVIAPVRCPETVGVKVTAIVQVAPGASAEPQVLDCAKSPEAVIEEMVAAAAPLLVSVIVCGGLVVCSAWLPKVRLVDDTVTDAEDEGGGGVLLLPLLPHDS